MESESRSVNKGVIAVVVIALLAIAATTVALVGNNTNEDTTAEMSVSPSTTVSDTSTSPDVKSEGGFTAGTYDATGSYRTPGGQESVTVSVTLSGNDGTIESIETTGTGAASGGESREYQGKFLANYKELVVGKKIDEVSLSRVAGSSLTSSGFNNALDEIAQDAAA